MVLGVALVGMKLPSSAFAKAMAGQVAKATTDKTAGGIIPKDSKRFQKMRKNARKKTKNARKYTWQDQK